MKISWVCFAVAASLCAADRPNREVQELQRDVAQLQEIVKGLQKTMEERLGNLSTQVQGAADAANKAGAAANAVQRGLEQLVRDQDQKLATPLTTLGGRIDQISGPLGTMQQAVTDLTAVVNKLQAQIGDLTIAVKAKGEPVAVPSATDLMTTAERDRSSGKLDLALQEYAEYLKQYGDTPQAADAQYYIAWIRYSLKDYAGALGDFDTLLKKYPESSRSADGLFYKSRTLAGLGRAAEAAEANRELKKRFPNYNAGGQK